MKVALLIERFTAKGGAERMASYVVTGLRKRGHDVHVFASHFESEGYTRHSIPAGSHTQFAERCRDAVASERFDVIHSFTRTLRHDILRLGGGIHAEYLRRMEPSRGALDRLWSRINLKERKILDLEREGLATARIIQAVSHRVKQEAIDHYAIEPSRIVVMHNGVDLARFRPELRCHRPEVLAELGIPSTAFVALFVGSGAKRKGLSTALAAIAHTEMHLIVVGDAPIETLPRTHFVGVRQDVDRFYGAADALVLPTLYDPFPNVCLEALACGVPVVVTRVAGISEIITDDVDSCIVDDPGEPAIIAQCLRHIQAHHATMSLAARALAEQHPIDPYIDKTVELYRRIARVD